jgi:PAS domain S-box-containing protein
MGVTVEMLQNVLDTLNIGVVAIDKNDRIVVFNRLAGEMLQQDPESRIGTSVLRCHPKESEPVVQKRISDLKNRVVERTEGWLDYRGRILYEHICPIWDGQGEYVGVLSEVYDAEDMAELLKRLGEWNDIYVSGAGDRAPRSPEGRSL